MTPPGGIRLVVLFGGQSAEHDVSGRTAARVLRMAGRAGYATRAVGITRDGDWVRVEPPGDRAKTLEARGTRIEPPAAFAPRSSGETVVAFPAVHGPMGEDGALPGLFEVLGLPYVGAGVLGSALAMDKAMAKGVLAEAGLPQARYRAFRDVDIDRPAVERAVDELGLPAFVKPANLGSSIGITKAHTLDEVHAAVELALGHDEWIVIEEAIVGREIEVSVLGNDEVRVSVPGEPRTGAEFFDHDAKYGRTPSWVVVPAPLAPVEIARIQELAVAAYRALRAEGMARVDFLYDDGGRGPLLNEVNTIPGFVTYPALWKASGLPPHRLIRELVRLALERDGRRRKARRTSRVTTVRP